jgi:pimeloyl-ACP methyl ester carboxylesterase
MICFHNVLANPSRFFISLVFMLGLIALPLRAGDFPVVFVPGLGGTRLVEKRTDKPDRPVWVAPSLMRPATDDRPAAMEDLRLTREGKDRPDIKISPGEMLLSLRLKASMELRISDPDFDEDKTRSRESKIENEFQTRNLLDFPPFPIPVYGGFKSWAEARWPGKGWFSVAPYDWRKGAGEESDRAIDEAVSTALNDTGQSQVILIAHSLGGLAARHYISNFDKGKRVRGFISVGTAWLGAPKPARALRFGYCFGLGGRVGLDDEHMIDGIYIYHRETDKDAYNRHRYISSVSLIDLDKAKSLASTMPAVFQLLPTKQYMEFYGKAVGVSERSVFAGEDPDTTLKSFESANPLLMQRAREKLSTILDNDDHGVDQTTIAGTLDPSMPPESAMDMRIAQDSDEGMSWTGFDFKSLDGSKKRPSIAEIAEKALEVAEARQNFISFLKVLREQGLVDRKVAKAFFEINPVLRDFGNFNWHWLRAQSIEQARKTKGLPLFADNYIAVHSDARGLDPEKDPSPPRWGDGATPLLSATFGRRSFMEVGAPVLSETLRSSPIGKVNIRIVPLGRDKQDVSLEHSRMLESEGVQDLIAKAYRATCDRTK